MLLLCTLHLLISFEFRLRLSSVFAGRSVLQSEGGLIYFGKRNLKWLGDLNFNSARIRHLNSIPLVEKRSVFELKDGEV